MMEKTCKTCKLLKPLEDFRQAKTCIGGRSHRCISCDKQRQLNNYYKNQSIRQKNSRDYQNKKKDLPEYLQYHREYSKEYSKLPEVVSRRRKRNRDRRVEDLGYRLSRVLRERLKTALKRKKKLGSAVADLGCTLLELKKHLESQFKTGMTWENHGFHGWHVDHIVPLAAFDLTDREQFLKACHYTNLQPLWASENLQKHAKVAQNG